MITRRKILLGSMAAGAAAIWPSKLLMSKASQPSTPVDFAVPSNACDCHTHIFGDPHQFPFFWAAPIRPSPHPWRRCAHCTGLCAWTAW